MLIQNIQKSWDGSYNIAKSLKDLIKLDSIPEEPSRSESNKTNTDEKTLEQAGFNIKYQEELQIFLERKDVLEKGFKKAFAYIFSNFALKPCNNKLRSTLTLTQYKMTL